MSQREQAQPGDRTLLAIVLALNVPLAANAIWLALWGVALPEALVSTDFTVFRTAWWLILHGQAASLYDATAQQAAQRVVMSGWRFDGGLMAFLNPPHVALAGLPFGWLAERAGGHAAFLVWSALELVLLARFDWLVRDTLGLRAGLPRWLCTTLLLAFYPVLYTVSVGQLSLLLAVAALELERALARGRPGARAAAAWLLVFGVKPQLLPAVVALLAARRAGRVLALAAAGAAVIAALTAAALGPSIWLTYLRSVHGLEGWFGTRAVACMMNVRGQLTRLLGGEAAPGDAIAAVATAVWLVAAVVLGVALARAHRRRADAGSSELALALAVALVTSPHLFAQDATLWVAVFALHLAALAERGLPRRGFASFAMCWPLLFGVARIADLYGTREPRLRVDPVFVAMLAATAAIARATVLGPGSGSGDPPAPPAR